MGFRVGPFVLCKNGCWRQRRRNTKFGSKKVFSTNNSPSPPHLSSQNDQRDVGIILSHRCWVDPPPPPRHGRSGTPALNPPPPVTAAKEGGGGVGKMGFRVTPPPPPRAIFFPPRRDHYKSMSLFPAERRLVAEGFCLTVSCLTRIYCGPVPAVRLLVLGIGRFSSAACVLLAVLRLLCPNGRLSSMCCPEAPMRTTFFFWDMSL